MLAKILQKNFGGKNEKMKKIAYILSLSQRREAAVPGLSPGRGLLILHGYLHPDKSEYSEVQSPSIIAGAVTMFHGWTPTDLKNMTDRQEWKGQSFYKKNM